MSVGVLRLAQTCSGVLRRNRTAACDYVAHLLIFVDLIWHAIANHIQAGDVRQGSQVDDEVLACLLALVRPFCFNFDVTAFGLFIFGHSDHCLRLSLSQARLKKEEGWSWGQ